MCFRLFHKFFYVGFQRGNLQQVISILKTLFSRKSGLKKDEVGIVSGLNDAHEVIRGFMHVKQRDTATMTDKY